MFTILNRYVDVGEYTLAIGVPMDVCERVDAELRTAQTVPDAGRDEVLFEISMPMGLPEPRSGYKGSQ